MLFSSFYFGPTMTTDNPTKYFAKIKLEHNKDFIKLRKK